MVDFVRIDKEWIVEWAGGLGTIVGNATTENRLLVLDFIGGIGVNEITIFFSV